MNRILHVGCGTTRLPDDFCEGQEFEETRLDVDPLTQPDIVASMTRLGEIGPFETVFCNHALEHLYPHEVDIALREFERVLAPGGKAIVCVPDLEDVRPTERVLYISPAGPIAGLDLYYGHRASIAEVSFMAHHCGFVAGTLRNALEQAGFVGVTTHRLSTFNLMGIGGKS